MAGGDGQNWSSLLRPLGLSAEEMDDLVAFFLALTGDEILVEVPASRTQLRIDTGSSWVRASCEG